VILQAGEFAGDDAEVFGAFRDFDAGKFLDGERVAPVVGDGADVVEAVGVRHRAEEGLVLGDLLVIPVEVAEDRLEPDDDFAVEDDVHAEDAVGRRVLRAHGDFEEFLSGSSGERFECGEGNAHLAASLPRC
jgi:hypothetical protein